MAVICEVCSKIFTLQKNLFRHMREVHQIKANSVSYDFTVHNSKCLEKGCKSSFRTIQDLRNHLQDTHAITFVKEELNFENFDEFRLWLSSVSNSENARYIQSTTRENSSSNSETIYFYCNRGRQTFKLLPPNATRKRKLKSQSTCKIKMTCTSTILVTRCLMTNKCSVAFFKTHYGHFVQLQYVRLPPDQMAVATKPASDVSAAELIRQKCAEIANSNLESCDLNVLEYVLKQLNNVYNLLQTNNDIVVDKAIDFKNNMDSSEEPDK